MKNFAKRFLVALLVLLSCSQSGVFAEESNEPDDIPVVPYPGCPDPVPGPCNRGRALARTRTRYVETEPQCYYYEGAVTILADNAISFISAQVVRAEDNMTWINAGVGNTITLTVSSDPGTYYLYFTLSNGKSYIGKYILY